MKFKTKVISKVLVWSCSGNQLAIADSMMTNTVTWNAVILLNSALHLPSIETDQTLPKIHSKNGQERYEPDQIQNLTPAQWVDPQLLFPTASASPMHFNWSKSAMHPSNRLLTNVSIQPSHAPSLCASSPWPWQATTAQWSDPVSTARSACWSTTPLSRRRCCSLRRPRVERRNKYHDFGLRLLVQPFRLPPVSFPWPDTIPWWEASLQLRETASPFSLLSFGYPTLNDSLFDRALSTGSWWCGYKLAAGLLWRMPVLVSICVHYIPGSQTAGRCSTATSLLFLFRLLYLDGALCMAFKSIIALGIENKKSLSKFRLRIHEVSYIILWKQQASRF